MGQKRKRLIRVIVYCVLIVMLFGGNIDGAKYNVKAAETVTSMSSSFYEKENIVVSIENNRLYFTKLPDKKAFTKILVSLYTVDGETINKQSLSGALPYSYDLKGVENGKYYLQLYSMKKQDTQGKIYYSSYWYQQEGIALVKDSSGWHISMPETYESNKQLLSIKSKQEETLKKFLQPSSMIDAQNESIIAMAKKITEGITEDYDKVVAVHDWVTKNICFDYDVLYGDNNGIEIVASDVLKSRKTVCQGFADLSAALLRALEIPTKIVEGYTLGFGGSSTWTNEIFEKHLVNHTWNESYVDGRWVVFDTTWDSGNVYENGQYTYDSSDVNYQYFDPTMERFSATHYIVDLEGEDFFEEVSKIALPQNETIYVGEEKNILDSIPADITAFWESENEKVVEITKNGELKGIDPGYTKVKLFLCKGDYTKIMESTCCVTKTQKGGANLDATKGDVPECISENSVSSTVVKAHISVICKKKKIKKGKKYSLKAKTEGIKGKIKWKSGNAKIATVSQKGVVKGKKKGTVRITAAIGRIKGSVRLKIYG